MIHEIWTWVTSQLVTNHFLSGAVLGGSLLGILHHFRAAPKKIWEWLETRITVSVTFTSQDYMYVYVQQWLALHRFDQRHRRYRFSTADGLARGIQGKGMLIGNNELDIASDEEDEERVPPYNLAPNQGRYIIRYGGRRILVSCDRSDPTTNSSSFMLYEQITLYYFGWRKTLLHKLMTELEDMYRRANAKKIRIYLPQGIDSGAYWGSNNHNKLGRRSPESVITTAGLVEEILADVRWFLTQQEYYKRQDIPYHRTYLFQGPPGTGKTSMIKVIASELKRNVHYLAIDKETSDATIMALISGLTNNSILTLEDIDCLFEDKRTGSKVNNLNFSTLLNSLDGFCSPEGIITVMTTNHPEKLDPALIRKGRVDFVANFPYCDADMIDRLVSRFFPDASETQRAMFGRCWPTYKYPASDLQDVLLRSQTMEEAIQRSPRPMRKTA